MAVAFFLCETVEERSYPTGSAWECLLRGRLGHITLLVDVTTPPEVGRAYRFEVTPVPVPAVDPNSPIPPEAQIREAYRKLANKPLPGGQSA